MSITIPTPTTTSNMIDTRTTWTVGDHSLILVERKGARPDQWFTRRLNSDTPTVSEDTDYNYSVNWSALGDRTPEEASEYAASLEAAANAARVFTAIRNEYSA